MQVDRVLRMTTDEKTLQRVAAMPFASVYPHYVTKVEKKGRAREELHAVITWLTGYDDAEIQHHLDAETPFEEFFAQARLNESAELITGVVRCSRGGDRGAAHAAGPLDGQAGR